MALGIEVGSSLRLTTPKPLLKNASFASVAVRLASGQVRHTAWDYHDEDTGTYWRIKPLSQCFLADGTTPATQAGTWGTLPAHWTQQTYGGATGYDELANRVTAAEAAIVAVGGDFTAGRVAYVEGRPGGNLKAGRIGDPLRPFNSLAEAVNNTPPGTTIVVRPGGQGTDALGRRFYTETVVMTGNRVVLCEAGAVIGGSVDIGAYRGSQPFSTVWVGGTIIGAVAVLRQRTGPLTMRFESPVVEGIGQIKAFSECGLINTAHTDIVDIINLRARPGAGSTGAVALTGHDGFGPQKQVVSLLNADMESAGTPLVEIRPSENVASATLSRLTLRGTTRLSRADGGAPINVVPVNSGGITPPLSDVLVDERLPALPTAAGDYALRIVVGEPAAWVASGSTPPAAPAVTVDDTSNIFYFTPAAGTTAADYGYEPA